MSPSRIRLLPERTVNRIAAGEVIERPEAAVRELVENALDAGALRIAVVLEAGGIDRIEVVDDGGGMTPEELALAVRRHATSKLPEGADAGGVLEVRTLGFRGEALPSIGAAARLRLVSRPPGAESAWALAVEGGVAGAPEPVAGPPGTRVLVRDLFYATPARRKFLKSPRSEADAAEASVRNLAIAAPQVAFRLESDGRVAFDLPPQELAERVAALLGAGLGLLPLAHARLLASGATAALAGFAGDPAQSRASPIAQVLVVNGRPVADRLLRTAVRVAYRDVIAAGRHAVVALSLSVPAAEVDVNVHPAKAELRFRDEAGIRALVIGGLGRALATGAAERRPGSTSAGAAPSPWPRPGLRLHAAPGRGGMAEAQLGLPDAAWPPAPPRAPGSDPDGPPSPGGPLGSAIAQVFDTYVVALAADGELVLVDQHAAHERLTHEALAEQLRAGGVRRQPLLLPAVVDLPAADALCLAAHAGELDQLGLEIEPFGPGAILVRALPALLGSPDPGPLLRDLADQFAADGVATALAARLDAALARLACHGSIRAGRRLAPAEMDRLLRAMEATPRASTCSHGRPTVLRLGRAELARMFHRT